ncbi:hypothetical protein [Lysinibacillus sp. TE18511]
MSFIQIEEQIERELLCIDDLTKEISMLARKGETGKAHQRKQDLHFSLKQLEKLRECKRLWSTVADLNKNGTLQRAVKEVVEMA